MPFTKKNLLHTLAFGAALIGTNALFEGIQKLKLKMDKEPAFKRMMDMHPQLHKMDPNEVIKYWDNLYHFAPKMAQEPLAAGAYILQVSRLADFGGPTTDHLKAITEIQEKTTPRKSGGNRLTDSNIFMNAIAGMADIPLHGK